MKPFFLHQPGSSPLTIPQQEPNPAYAPRRTEPNLPPPPSREREPAPAQPQKVPEKV